MRAAPLFCVLLFSFCQAKVNFNIYEDECIREVNADREEISLAFSQDFFPEENQDFKDFLSCAWRKEGLIDKDGNIVRERFQQFLFNNFRQARGSNTLVATLVAADTMHHCRDVKAETAGDTAVKMSNCIIRRIDSYED